MSPPPHASPSSARNIFHLPNPHPTLNTPHNNLGLTCMVPVADADTLSGHKVKIVLFAPNWNLSNWITATNWCFSTRLTQRSVFARNRNSFATNGRIGQTSLSKPSTTSSLHLATQGQRQCDPVVPTVWRACLTFLGRSLHAQLSKTSSLFLRP